LRRTTYPIPIRVRLDVLVPSSNMLLAKDKATIRNPRQELDKTKKTYENLGRYNPTIVES
jgi:hypothetical protein